MKGILFFLIGGSLAFYFLSTHSTLHPEGMFQQTLKLGGKESYGYYASLQNIKNGVAILEVEAEGMEAVKKGERVEMTQSYYKGYIEVLDVRRDRVTLEMNLKRRWLYYFIHYPLLLIVSFVPAAVVYKGIEWV